MGNASFLFQFTHPGRGATDISEVITTALTEFQFTHPGRGATLEFFLMRFLLMSFNSRTPGGVRL